MFIDGNTLIILVIALLIDFFIGDPDWLWKRFNHPVTYFARLIHFFEKLRGGTISSYTDKTIGYGCYFYINIGFTRCGICFSQTTFLNR